MIELDGSEDKSRLGANAILGVSMAAANAAAAGRRIPLFEYLGKGRGRIMPLPEIQIFGGGAHANWRIDIQDFLIIALAARDYSEALEMTYNVRHQAGELLRQKGKLLGLADEGGFWPDFRSHEEGFETLIAAIDRAGYQAGKEVALSLDIAASDLYDPETRRYRLGLENRSFESDAFAQWLHGLVQKYAVVSVEDPMADTDWDGWKIFFKLAGPSLQVIGDDLFTTHLQRIRRGIQEGVANAALIKLNQIGTVTETQAAIEETQKAGWAPVISARSGETEDAFIAHLAVGANAGQIKVGAFARGERMAKWNELLRIARRLGDKATYLGAKALAGQ